MVVVLGVHDFLNHAETHPPIAANWLAVVLVPCTLALVVTGTLVTAAGPHSGGDKIRRYGLLPDALHLHVGAVAIFAIVFVGLVASLHHARPRVPRGARARRFGAGRAPAQMLIGDIQWRTHLPWGLVLVHVALGTAVWAAMVALATMLLLRSRPRLP